MSKKKKTILRTLAIVLAVLTPLASATIAFADSSGDLAPPSASKYSKPDINALTGHGAEPEELSVSAATEYNEKAWYEYVCYSERAVCSYRIDDDTRLLFYDPYTYSNAMIMDWDFDPENTCMCTMSSYQVSHTNSKTISTGVSSTDTRTEATQTSGRDETHSKVENSGTTKTVYNHTSENTPHGKIFEDSKYTYKEFEHETTETTYGLVASLGAELGTTGAKTTACTDVSTQTTDITDNAWRTDTVTNTTEYSEDYKTTTSYGGDDTVIIGTSSETDGWTQLAARVTKTTGSSTSTNRSWSELEGTTVTKTYAATHFAADGVTPLPWGVVHYAVRMPMKCCLQLKSGGEWLTVSTVYCLLTTIQGECRAWIQNGQTYLEDWGNGEPVLCANFWSGFMSPEALIAAYRGASTTPPLLYPARGES